MRTAYQILFEIFFWLAAPFYFLKMWRRGNWRDGFRQRFGYHGTKIKQAITNRQVLWLHAVSVGEVNLCTQLIRALEPRLPNVKILVSTTTTTGMGELRRRLPSHIEKIYYPVDRRRCVQRALSALHPEAIILVEAEIWPNFLRQAHRRRIPVFLVNARLSERSYRGYRRFGFFFRDVFATFKGVGVQNPADAQRLIELGCRPERVHVVGNMKFDSARVDEKRFLEVRALLKQLGVNENARLLVGGSTHAGEEILLARTFQRLKARFNDLFLVLVPRHFERGKQVGQELADGGVKFKYRSEITASTRLAPGSVECLLVNTTGELRFFYEEADVIFVGKSITAKGGQNPIEPGALGKAMIFGPNMQNFAAVTAAFVEKKAALQIQRADELENAIRRLLEDADYRAQLGRNALEVVRENRGAVDRTVEMIIQHLHEEDVYVAPK